MTVMKKSKTGIPGFDKLVQGGFPTGANILLCGTPGSAKSIFSLQYAYNGAMMYGEKSMYVSFEQSKDSIERQAVQFGWNLAAAEKKGLLHVKNVPVKKIDHTTFPKIIEYVKQHKIKRLVIDSLSTLSINAPMYAAINELFLKDLIMPDNIYAPSLSGDYMLKRFIYMLIGELQDLNVTCLLISEIEQGSEAYSRDTVSEFLCDGIVQMTFESMGGKYSRSLLVRKMRHVKNDEDIHPVEIGKKGLVVHGLSDSGGELHAERTGKTKKSREA
ncbi:AAA family ATPase [Candidatus Woesearchaeota archaeon]|nr:AAA family ATPase [Candidatus Woesearchaeota archaeon]